MRLKERIYRFIHNENVHPLPFGTILTLFFVTFLDAILTSSLFAYLPHLIKWFGISEVETGNYAGILGGAIFASRIFSCYIWGYISDRFGEKRTLLVTFVCFLISTGIFCFTTNYYWALLCRILQGSLTATKVLNKCILNDVLDSTNQELGYTFVFSAYTLGVMIGPAIGGYMSFPSVQYPNTFSKNSFFAKYPIFLPNCFMVVLTGISILLIFRYIPEKKQNGSKLEINVEESDADDEPDSSMNVSLNNATVENEQTSERTRLIKANKKSNWFLNLWTSEGFFTIVIIYGMLGLLQNGYLEILPVFAATTSQYNGLSMSLSQIGTLYIMPQLFSCFINIVFTPKFIRHFATRVTICLSLLIFITGAFIIVPMNLVANIPLRWFFLMLSQVIWDFGINLAYVSLNMAIRNSVDSNSVGISNGLVQTVSSIGRTIGPVLFGVMYSWSLTNIKEVKGQEDRLGFPFNQYFTFIVMVICGICVSSLGYYLLPPIV